LATLAGGLQSHRPDLLDGVGLIVGIDRFMSEARAVTNFSGNAGATMLVGSWTKTIDRNKVNAVLGGSDPFDELTMCRSTGAGANPCACVRLHLGPVDRTVAVSLDCARH
jgi:aerobic C4-dicarboxylate transport protein